MSFFNLTESNKTDTKEIPNITKIKKITKKCTHYNNNLLVYADCCKEYFECHLCHNEDRGHTMNRPLINKIKCINCNEINTPKTHCEKCNIEFGKTYCNLCKVWCSNIKETFHCHKCKKCRIGNIKNYFHCDECNVCYSNNCKGKHICKIINNNKNDNCSICLDKIFNRDDRISVLRCSHLMHTKCLDGLLKNDEDNEKIPSCTICKKSIKDPQKYTSKFDRYLYEYPMPDYYKKWISEILCNDCNEKTNAPYHMKYHKCAKCKSYNTNLSNVIKNN